jgi:hypothetical protein
MRFQGIGIPALAILLGSAVARADPQVVIEKEGETLRLAGAVVSGQLSACESYQLIFGGTIQDMTISELHPDIGEHGDIETELISADLQVFNHCTGESWSREGRAEVAVGDVWVASETAAQLGLGGNGAARANLSACLQAQEATAVETIQQGNVLQTIQCSVGCGIDYTCQQVPNGSAKVLSSLEQCLGVSSVRVNGVKAARIVAHLSLFDPSSELCGTTDTLDVDVKLAGTTDSVVESIRYAGRAVITKASADGTRTHLVEHLPFSLIVGTAYDLTGASMATVSGSAKLNGVDLLAGNAAVGVLEEDLISVRAVFNGK